MDETDFIMMRILLFLATNIAVMIVISVFFCLLNIIGVLNTQYTNLKLDELLIATAAIGMTGAFISLIFSKWIAIHAMHVQLIEQPENNTEKWLLHIVERQAQKIGISTPEVGIFPGTESNAFAIGMHRDRALIAISSGLLQNMSAGEIEAVIGHEISHVANGDMVTLALMQGVVNTFVYFFAGIIGRIVDRGILQNAQHTGIAYHFTQMLAQIVLGFLASMLVMWFSRHRELKADADGAALAGKFKMIAALRALKREAKPQQLPVQLVAFAINGHHVKSLFASHPPLDERITKLEGLR